jgi:carboxylesterase
MIGRNNNNKLNGHGYRKTGGEAIVIDRKGGVGILMIHGFSSTPRQFKELAAYSAEKGFTVHAPLIVGHGTSPKKFAKTNSQDWLNSAKKAYDDLRSKVDRVFIVGNSFGGNLAFAIAKDAGPELKGIISLGTPIVIRLQKLIKLRIYTYGLFKKYYRKPQKVYKIDYTDLVDEITYPVIPIKCIKEFMHFVEQETIPNLDKVKVPSMIVHANIDPVVNPKSAQKIHEGLGSRYKMIYWFDSENHDLFTDRQRFKLFKKMHQFIKEVDQGDK